MTVKTDHVTKHLAKKLKKGNYGSVLIQIRDGVITAIIDKSDFNSDAFIDHVEHPVSRVVVRSCKPKDKVITDDILTEVSENDQNSEEMIKNGDNNDNNLVKGN